MMPSDIAQPTPPVEFQKSCSACECWSPRLNNTDGECRASPPSFEGWARTKARDWCFGGWTQRTSVYRIAVSGKSEDLELGCVGFNYDFIRRNMPMAMQWLSAALQQQGRIPKAFLPVFNAPRHGRVTGLIPLNGDDGSCEEVLQWAHSLPGGQMEEITDNSRGIVAFMHDPELRKGNESARRMLSDTSEWFRLFDNQGAFTLKGLVNEPKGS